MSHQIDAPPSTESLARRQELRDLSTRALVVGLVALAIVTAVAMWLMVALFDVLETRGAATDRRSPLVETGVQPPQPRLETTQGGVLSQLRALEQVQLTTYGWVDRQEGIARVPIERAMELLAAGAAEVDADAEAAADPQEVR